MSSSAVVEDLDVGEQARLGLFSCQVLLAVYQLLLERGKEALTTRSRVPGALSQQLPFLLMLQAMPCSSSFS